MGAKSTEYKFDTRGELSYDDILECVHCGLCLSDCPTYRILGNEMDSPRGRLYLIKAMAEDKLPITERLDEHIYLCLECRACETACPSGVHFGRVMESARDQLEQRRQRGLISRTVRYIGFHKLLPSKKMMSLLGFALRLYKISGIQALVRTSGLLKILPGNLEVLESLTPDVSKLRMQRPLHEVTGAVSEKKCRVGFLSGCMMGIVFGEVNRTCVRVLAENGCEVIAPRDQTCCGALHAHNGEREKAKQLATHNIDVFEKLDVEAIVVNAAGCGATMKEYGELLKNDPVYAERAEEFSRKVKDISEFLCEISFRPPGGEIKSRVAYDEPCHLLHGQGVSDQPKELLKSIPGLELVRLKEADWCCGSAGIYNISNCDVSMEILERKIANIAASGAETVATGNPGCMIQIKYGLKRANLNVEVVHPVELLDRAYSNSNT